MNRERLPGLRHGWTHTVTIAGTVTVTFTVNEFLDGRPGEVFLDEYEVEGEEVQVDRTLEQWCIAISLMLQDHHDLKHLVMKFGLARYPPNGFTDDADIRDARSVTDYIIRKIGKRYLPTGEEEDEPRRDRQEDSSTSLQGHSNDSRTADGNGPHG